MPRGVPEPWDEEMLARAAGMKRAGIPTAAIAERLGVSIGSVANRLSRLGVRRKLNGGVGRLTDVGSRRLAAIDLRDAFDEERGVK